MNKIFIAAFMLTLAGSFPSAAADKSAPNSSGNQSTGGDAISAEKTTKKESLQPMNMDEPMPTGMAKQGMKKGDVKAHAKKKEAAMDEMMKQEEMKK